MNRSSHTLLVTLVAGGLAACSSHARPAPAAPAEPTSSAEPGAAPAPAAGQVAVQPSVILPATPEPAVSVAVWFQVGSIDDPPGKEGLASLTAQMIARGATRSHRYDEIVGLLYPMASDYDISVDREMTVLDGEVHRDHATAYLALFTEAFTQPAFDPADFERLKAEAVAHIEKDLRYALDEELGKAAFFGGLFAGTSYAHPAEGTVTSLKAITLDDVKKFWHDHYTADRTVFGLAGNYTDAIRATLEGARAQLPAQVAAAPRAAAPRPVALAGRRVLLVDKPGADASISFGAPIDVRRGNPDFAALYLVASWLGEHRSSAGHLYQVIRSARGLNYGDYAYVEAYPHGGEVQTPLANVGRRQQAFEVWLRTLPNDNAVFALRAALREIDRLIDKGMTEQEFALTRDFLKKYTLQFAPSTHRRLLWAIDDRFYGETMPHLEALRAQLDQLTVGQVNAAIKRHLSTKNLLIAIASGKTAEIRQQLVSGAATKPSYATPKPQAVLTEDETISVYPLGIGDKAIQVVPVDDMFARGSR